MAAICEAALVVKLGGEKVLRERERESSAKGMHGVRESQECPARL